jgi:predicted short-subunit dehydrogenase-like oxidoreductase (DUF2520 family)
MTAQARYRQIGIVGTGRAAQALALGLAPHSAGPPMMWGRSEEKLRRAVERIGTAIAVPHRHLLAGACDLVVLAVSDDAIGGIAADLARDMGQTDGRFVFHISGRSGAGILAPLRASGALTAAIHPAMTFTGDPPGEVARMTAAHFAITGSTPEASEEAREIVALLGGCAAEVAEAYRPIYHAALSHASNHLVTLIAGASHALRIAGVDAPTALLAPLVRAALENSLADGFAALSGPLLRGDAQTIADHLAALEAHDPGLLPAYRAMARATLDELDREGSPPASALRAVLD